MKTSLCVTIGCALFLCACVTNKTYRVEEKKMRIGSSNAMIIKAGGDTVVGKRLSLPSEMHQWATWIKFDGSKIESTGIQAVQDDRSFYAKFGDDKSYRWVKQVKRGKINLFYYETQSTTGYYSASNPNKYTYATHFVVQKENGPLQDISIAAMAEYLKDNRAAYAKFVQKFGDKDKKFLPKDLQKHPKVLFEAVDIYNEGS